MASSTSMGAARGRRPQPGGTQLNWRLYRLCLAPVLIALLVAAFAFSSPSAPLGSSLSPEAFEGGKALAQLRQMTAIAPARQPGSRGDRRLLAYLEGQLESLGAPGSGGFRLQVVRDGGQLSWGGRSQTLLVASRAGSAASKPPIALIADRASLASGAAAQLSGAATLLELATVLSSTETTHPLELVFDDEAGGGAQAAAQWLASSSGARPPRLDAAIVLGDLAGSRLRKPLVQPFSDALGGAPEVLTATVAAALRGSLGASPGMPSLSSQLAHLAFPLAVGQQGALNATGIPSVSVSLSGEREPRSREPVSETHLQALGRGVLSAFYALDHGPEIPALPSAGLRISGRLLPQWPVALLALTLLIAPLALAADALVRISRRGERIGRWLGLPVFYASPFMLVALALKAIAALGIVHASAGPAAAVALRLDAGSACAAVVAIVLLALCWRSWRRISSAVGLGALPRSGAAGIAALGGGCLLCLLIWLVSPYASLLMIPALHLWLPALCGRRRPSHRAARLALVLAPTLPLVLLIVFYALWLGLSPAQVALEGIVMVAGGHVSFGGVLLWCLAIGTLTAIALQSIEGDRADSEQLQQPRWEQRMPVRAGRRPVYRGSAPSGRGARALR